MATQLSTRLRLFVHAARRPPASVFGRGQERFISSLFHRIDSGVSPCGAGAPAAGRRRMASSEAEDRFRGLGYLDERCLLKFDTLHELQDRSCAVYASNALFGTYSDVSKSFEFMTYREFDEKVKQVHSVLRSLDLKQGDKVAMISNNRWEWAAIATAAYSLNASIVPMYEAQLASDWTYIINDSGARVVFCGTQDVYSRVREQVVPNTPGVSDVLSLSGDVSQPHTFAHAMENHGDSNAYNAIPPTPDDLADLIYTSGTTGRPKGVELVHSNFVSNVQSAGTSMVEKPKEDLIREDDRSLAFLPWAHSYGQTCELWMGMAMGSSTGICRGVPHILEDLQLVRPSVLISVPTLYKKVYDGVHNMIQTSSPLKARMMASALAIGREHDQAVKGNRRQLSNVEKIKFQVLDRLVLSKIRDRFGGRLRYGTVAGAACPIEVMEFMDSIGIPVCEGYGLTETSPIITLNVPTNRRVGSVGRPIGGVRVFVVDSDGNEVPNGREGEICCVGPNVMRGYHNEPSATSEVISTAPDGESRMFHTGDLGTIDEEGWVRVTGRLKEQYKLENGKYVVPTAIEEAIGLSRFISQVVLCGANRPHNVALLVPAWEAIRKELKFDVHVPEEELARDDRVRRLIDAEVMRSCAPFKKFEVPTKWAFVAPFAAENGMVTPKMSVRRHKVTEAYEDVIAYLYNDDPAAADAAGAAAVGLRRVDGDTAGVDADADAEPGPKAA